MELIAYHFLYRSSSKGPYDYQRPHAWQGRRLSYREMGSLKNVGVECLHDMRAIALATLISFKHSTPTFHPVILASIRRVASKRSSRNAKIRQELAKTRKFSKKMFLAGGMSEPRISKKGGAAVTSLGVFNGILSRAEVMTCILTIHSRIKNTTKVS